MRIKNTPLAASVVLVLAGGAMAQVNTELVVRPGSTVTTTVQPDAGVTTTVQSPDSGGVTTTTKVTATPARSTMFNLKDGKRLEVDFDGSVYIVYPDGARVTAPDGINTLQDGTGITVKDGKRVP